MRLVVFGASGATGQEIVRQALELGHEVTAVVRDPKKLAVSNSRLHTAQCDVLQDQASLATAIATGEAFISALGVGNSLISRGLIARSMAAIVAVAEKQTGRRFILISAFGVGDSHRQAPVIPRILYRLLLADIYHDKKAGEDILSHSGLDWTIIQPVMLTNGPRTGTYRVGERLSLKGIPKVSRADVAHFAVAQLTDSSFLRKIVVISN